MMITFDQCTYPGCLGPGDGSECRHPNLDDEESTEATGQSECRKCGWTGELIALEFGADACPGCGKEL